MNDTLLGLGLVGWIVSLIIGFVVGGIFFLSMRLQVEYVVEQKGPLWVMPVALYARIGLVAVILVLVAVNVPGEKVPAAVISATAGAMVARVLVARSMKRAIQEQDETNNGD